MQFRIKDVLKVNFITPVSFAVRFQGKTMIKYITIIISVIFFISCEDNNEKKLDEPDLIIYDYEYKRNLNFFIHEWFRNGVNTDTIAWYNGSNESINISPFYPLVDWGLHYLGNVKVEDSINKQFQLKTAIAVNKINPSMDLKEMQKKLKLIYNVRSNIAHGNFTSLNKQFESNSKMESLDFFLDSLSFELLLYITDIIKLYLNDREYINFLKDS